MKNPLTLALFLFAFLNIASAYTVFIHAPAVLQDTDTGILTGIYLNVTSGTGIINVSTGSSGTVGEDTLASAHTAVVYAGSYLAVNISRYNFRFTILSNNSNISGPSAGLALTLLSVAGLEQRQLNDNFTVTGTINPNGTVGQIGGIFDKVQAAKSISAKYILVPYLNSSNYQYFIYYIAQQAYGVPVVPVKNVSQALPYALGSPQIALLNYTAYYNYSTSGLPLANSSCQSCNDAAFSRISNFTLNFTQNEINGINGAKFGSVKSQMQSELDQFSIMASKGYLYSAADFAFNEYPTAFLLTNYNDSNLPSAESDLNYISAYCNSVNASPTLTDLNYEYVIGGQARHQWAEITLANAYNDLNASQTSDDVFLVLQEAAPAYSWCMATAQMYNVAGSLGGTNITLPYSVQQQAGDVIEGEQGLGSSALYISAAKQDYAQGDYGAALYSAEYANVFYNASNIVFTNATMANSTVSSAISSANTIWAQQFAYQSKMYLYLASNANSTLQLKYIEDAYTTALLSKGIGNVNAYLQSNFAINNTQANVGNLQQQLSQAQSELQLILTTLVIIIILLVIIIVVLLLHILEHKPEPRKKKR